MAAPSVIFTYGSFGEALAKSTIDLDLDTLKVSLVTSGYSPNLGAHDRRADFSASELATGSGYTNGGATLAGVTVLRASLITTLDASNTEWTASGGTIGPFRYAVLYANVTRNGIVDPLIGYCVPDSAPADMSVLDGDTFRLAWHASGILKITAT